MSGKLLSKSLSANHRWVYWDDFNSPMLTPGVFPDAPSGHKYTVLSQYPNTNQINLENGRWWMGATNGAIYLSTHFRTNGTYGTLNPPNVFEGTFSYHASTNGTVDGVERNLTFILSTNADFIAKPFLHISVGVAGFRVQRELSSTNIIYGYPLEGSRYLAFDTNHTFRVTIVSNNIICDYAGYRYIGYEPLLSTLYKDLNVATWESTGGPTNQFWGKWDSQRAGYSDGVVNWAFGGPFAVGSNGVLSSVTFADGTTQTTAYTGSGSGGGGPGTLPMNANQFDTNNPVSIKSGALTTNLSARGLTLPLLTTSRAMVINASGDPTNSPGVTATELEYLDNVTSPIQTQLNGKQNGQTNDSQFGASTILTLKDGLLGTNWIFRGVTLPTLTASRPAIIDASGNLTNATGTPDGTKFLRDDGTLAVPSGGTGSTNPVAFTAGSVGVSNYFGLGFTNAGSNAVQVIDCMGPQLVRSFINGNTTLVLTNMPAWTNAQYGGKLRLQVRHGSGTVTLASLHPINWGRPFFIAQGETNLLTIEFNGHELIGTLSHEPAEVNTAYASVVEIDQAIGQAVVWNITNRVTGNMSLILTNPVSSRQARINVIGEASGETDRTITLIPNTGSFVVNKGNTTARTNEYAFTLQDGYAVNIELDTAKLTGTNLWLVTVNEYAYGEAVASSGSAGNPSGGWFYETPYVFDGTLAGWEGMGGFWAISEEFLGDVVTGQHGQNHFATASTAGGQNLNLGGEIGAPGVMSMVTTNTGDRAGIYEGSGSLNSIRLSNVVVAVVARVQVGNPGSDLETIRIGLINSVTADGSAGFYLRATNDVWQGITAQASTHTSCNGSNVVAGQWTWLGAVFDGTNAIFYQGATDKTMLPFGTNSANIPNGSQMSPGILINRYSGTTARQTNKVDVFRVGVRRL